MTSWKRPETHWQLSAPASAAELERWAALYGVSAPMAQMLYARQLLPEVLSPALELTPNPALREAAAQMVQAIKAGRRIRIHGDYDADGVSATATLVVGLREVGANIHGFIPHRLKEGYGIHPERVSDHIEAADLLVTVDCGVSNHAEVAAMLEGGLKVIVTDHHSPGPRYPDTLVVHPQQTPQYQPALHNLTGAGVAYHLLWAIYTELGLPEPRQFTPMATLGTVADVAPLVGENRALVGAGLAEFATTNLPGLLALRGNLQAVTARDVGFVLAPLINAAGRMGHADLALEVLCATELSAAQEGVARLRELNTERQQIQKAMFEEALSIVDPSEPALVVTHEGWHAGIMGIVAAKLLETYYKPVYIVAQGKGSVRSTPGISAVGGLRHADDLLGRYGGHPGAAGFSLPEGNFAALRERIHEYARNHPTPLPAVALDALLPPAYLNDDFCQEGMRFEPFGEGWRGPQWHLRGELRGQKQIGSNGATLSFTAFGVRGIKFGQPRGVQGECDIATEVQRNDYQGRRSTQMMASQLRPAAPLSLASGPASVYPIRRAAAPAQAELQAGLAAYTSNPAITQYVQARFPETQLLETQLLDTQLLDTQLLDDAATRPAARGLILYDLPPEDLLRGWLVAGLEGGLDVVFAWGDKTLRALEGDLNTPAASVQPGPQERAAYRRWQWARLYTLLDDKGFARAACAMLGLPEPAPALAQANTEASHTEASHTEASHTEASHD